MFNWKSVTWSLWCSCSQLVTGAEMGGKQSEVDGGSLFSNLFQGLVVLPHSMAASEQLYYLRGSSEFQYKYPVQWEVSPSL